MRTQTGLDALVAYSADYINQFFDHLTDTVVLAPVLAFMAPVIARSLSTANSTIMRGAIERKLPGGSRSPVSGGL